MYRPGMVDAGDTERLVQAGSDVRPASRADVVRGRADLGEAWPQEAGVGRQAAGRQAQRPRHRVHRRDQALALAAVQPGCLPQEASDVGERGVAKRHEAVVLGRL